MRRRKEENEARRMSALQPILLEPSQVVVILEK